MERVKALAVRTALRAVCMGTTASSKLTRRKIFLSPLRKCLTAYPDLDSLETRRHNKLMSDEHDKLNQRRLG